MNEFKVAIIVILDYNTAMNVYFTASIVGKKHLLNNYLKIIEILKKNGCQVQSDHIINASEEGIRMETVEKRVAFHKKLESWINTCDFMVAEVSFPSISVGYEISMALHKGKSVLVLFSDGDRPSLISSDCEDRLVCEKYDASNLKETLEDFLKYAEGSGDGRFTFYITSEMAGHLDKMAKKERVPKAVYLRKLLQKDIVSHK